MIILGFILSIIISFLGFINGSIFFLFTPWILYIIYFIYFIFKSILEYLKNPPKTERQMQEENNENLKIIAEEIKNKKNE